MPLVNSLAGFIVAAQFDAGAQDGGTALTVEAAADLLGHGLESSGGDGREVASGQFGIQPAQLGGEGFEALLFRGDGPVDKILPLDGAEVLDEMLVFPAPEDEGAFSDAELLGDALEADPLGAQLDEFLNRFLVFH